MGEYFRKDGVKITHDPYASGMSEKYGEPGLTDNEGFDPYGDSVGPGIYGGVVQREEGCVVIGRQYQNHNPRPGPVYAGGGYTPTTQKLKSSELQEWFLKYPDLANEVTTGGASPLHNCGMSCLNEKQTAVVIASGGDVEGLDTYGYTPLHRMASNNLADGARALLLAGADPLNRGATGELPRDTAQSSAANKVLKVLAEFPTRRQVNVCKIVVNGGGCADVNTAFLATFATEIPKGFAKVSLLRILGVN